PLPVGWARKALLPALVTARVTLFDRSPAVDCWCHCSRDTATTWAILPVVTVISSGVGVEGSMNEPSSTNWASASFTHGMRATGASPSRWVVTTVDARRMRASGTASPGVKTWRSGLNESGVFGVVIGLIVIVFVPFGWPLCIRKATTNNECVSYGGRWPIRQGVSLRLFVYRPVLGHWPGI